MNQIEQNKLKTFLLFCISISYFNTIAQTVTTFAGSTQGYVDGIGTLAEFANPRGVAVASDGTIFVADINNHRIRKITSAGVVTTFAGGTEGFANGTGTSAKFDYPGSILFLMMELFM